jgi:hypothetical protein
MGTQVSQMKSISLDSWRLEQVEQMVRVGNVRANSVFEATLPKSFKRPTDTAFLFTFSSSFRPFSSCFSSFT